MKKLLALLLVITMAAGLCIPAAAEPEPDVWPKPEPDPYDAGWDAGWNDGYDDRISGAPSLYPADSYDTGYIEGYIDGYAYAEDEARWDSGYEAGYADGLNGVYNDPWDWESGDHDYSYASGYDNGYYAAVEAPPPPDEVIAGLGGTPGQVNVMLNGAFIDFADAVPVNQNGRVMVPVRAVLEALGAEVNYDTASKSVTAIRGETVLLHSIGSEVVEVYAGGDLTKEPAIFTMDCASYIEQSGRTMAPVRFLSEALGYTVLWDQTYQTVVIIDWEAFCAEYDGRFTVLNLLLSDLQRQMEPGRTCREDSSFELDLTMFDTLNGNRKLSASGKLWGLVNDKAVNAELSLELSDLVELLEENALLELADPEAAALLDGLKDFEVEVIYDIESDRLYVHSPLTDTALGQEAWITASLGSIFGMTGLEQLLFRMMPDTPMTVAGMALLAAEASDAEPLQLYFETCQAMDELETLLGDSQFRKSGSTYTWEQDMLGLYLMSAGMLDSLDGLIDMDAYDSELPDLSVTLTVKDTGNGACDASLDFSIGTEAFEATLNTASRGGDSDFSLSVHVKNTLEAELTAETSVTESRAEPKLAPPETEATVPFDEILYF